MDILSHPRCLPFNGDKPITSIQGQCLVIKICLQNEPLIKR